MRRLALLAALAAAPSAHATETGALVRFTACPVYRDADSGRKSGCWLADDRATGMRWDVSQSPYKPDWNYGILVEGRVAAGGGDACGAPALDPVRTSILPEPCPRHMLPPEGHPGRKFVLPPRNVAPMAVARALPGGPYGARVFPIFFEFDRAFITYQYSDFLIDQAATWLRAAKPKRIVVTGYAGTEPEEVSGRLIAERPEVARERADEIAETLRRLMPGTTVETDVALGAKALDHPDADTIPGQSQRRAEIAALF